MNKYRAKMYGYISQMDEYQLRLVLGFVERLFGLPEQSNIVEYREENAA